MGNATARPAIGFVRRRKLWGFLRAVVFTIAVASTGLAPCLLAADGDGKKPDAKTIAQGRTLFKREWQPGDSRSHGGDGLGPVYNDTSCVACHNSGGTGGAGSNGKNVDIVTATPNRQASVVQETVQHPVLDSVVKALRSLVGIEPAPAEAPAPAAAPAKPARPRIDTTALVKAHPGFRTARSIVLHQFGTEDKYEQWRQTFVGFPYRRLCNRRPPMRA